MPTQESQKVMVKIRFVPPDGSGRILVRKKPELNSPTEEGGVIISLPKGRLGQWVASKLEKIKTRS